MCFQHFQDTLLYVKEYFSKMFRTDIKVRHRCIFEVFIVETKRLYLLLVEFETRPD